MTSTAVYTLAAVLLGGPAVMLAPFALARRSAEQHADRAAAAIAACEITEAWPWLVCHTHGTEQLVDDAAETTETLPACEVTR